MPSTTAATTERLPAVNYTVAEVARALRVSERTVYQLCYDDKIESVLIGTARRIPVDAFEAYVKRLRGLPAA